MAGWHSLAVGGGRGPGLLYYLDYQGTIRELSGILPDGPACPAWPGLAGVVRLTWLTGLAGLVPLPGPGWPGPYGLQKCALCKNNWFYNNGWRFLVSILKTCPLIRLVFWYVKPIGITNC